MSEPNGALSIRDAARLSGLSRPEIRRSIEAGGFPGAAKDASGIWRIPLADLLVAGITIDLEECDLMLLASTALAEVRRLAVDRRVNDGAVAANGNGQAVRRETKPAVATVSASALAPEPRPARLAKPMLHWPIGEDA